MEGNQMIDADNGKHSFSPRFIADLHDEDEPVERKRCFCCGSHHYEYEMEMVNIMDMLNVCTDCLKETPAVEMLDMIYSHCGINPHDDAVLCLAINAMLLDKRLLNLPDPGAWMIYRQWRKFDVSLYEKIILKKYGHLE